MHKAGFRHEAKFLSTKVDPTSLAEVAIFNEVFFKILRFAQNDVIMHKAGFRHEAKFLSTKVDPTSSKNLIMFINKFIN